MVDKSVFTWQRIKRPTFPLYYANKYTYSHKHDLSYECIYIHAQFTDNNHPGPHPSELALSESSAYSLHTRTSLAPVHNLYLTHQQEAKVSKTENMLTHLQEHLPSGVYTENPALIVLPIWTVERLYLHLAS